MNNILNLTANIIFFIIISILSFSLVVLWLNYRKINVAWLQAEIDKATLLQRLEKFINSKETEKLEHTDGFVRFISESRDWAFRYIEDVQKSVSELKDFFENYNIEYTYLSPEELSDLKNIVNKVTSHLPEESKND